MVKENKIQRNEFENLVGFVKGFMNWTASHPVTDWKGPLRCYAK